MWEYPVIAILCVGIYVGKQLFSCPTRVPWLTLFHHSSKCSFFIDRSRNAVECEIFLRYVGLLSHEVPENVIWYHCPGPDFDELNGSVCVVSDSQYNNQDNNRLRFKEHVDKEGKGEECGEVLE